jgi:hypothetical protein
MLCVAIFFLINKEHIPAESKVLSTPRFIGAAVVAILLCLNALVLIPRLSTVPAPKVLVLLTVVALIGSAAYFLCRMYNASSRICALLGFLTIFSAAFMLTVTYLDRYTQMNAPHKLSVHLCMLAIMFAMLYEQRALLSRPAPRACVAVTAFAAALCATYSLSNILAFLGGIYTNDLYLFFDLAALGYAVYFVIKSIRFATSLAAASTEVER